MHREKKKFEDLEPHQKLGYTSERLVMCLLRAAGRKVKRMHSLDKFDLLVDDKTRIEVKGVDCSGDPKRKWPVNIHRHGIVNESDVDYYIIRLCNLDILGTYGIYLMFKAPVETSSFLISLRSLLTIHSDNAKMYRDFMMHSMQAKRKRRAVESVKSI